MTYDFSVAGTYTLKVAVVNAAATDPVNVNDTVSVIIKQLDNPAIDLSSDFIDDLETAADQTYSAKQIGLNGLDRYDFTTSSSFGRLRSFFNSGIAYSGSKALTLMLMNTMLQALLILYSELLTFRLTILPLMMSGWISGLKIMVS